MADSSLANLSINTIRTLSIDGVEKANSGHPGLPLGAAPMAYVLWQNHLRHNPRDPKWPDRDRFVLSAGHGSMLIYSLLHLAGYDVTLDDIKAFRQWESKTPGHPETFMTPGVEATTGPLGQGSANVVGMAMAERFLANYFNRPGHEIINHYTYALVSDGDLMEGVSAEAGSLAGHLGLGKLIYIYDANDITLDGPASLAFSREDVCKRYESYGWQVLRVEDGNNDLDGIDRALQEAKADTSRPTLIFVHTTIGFGSPKAGSNASHGAPLGAKGVAETKKTLGFDSDKHFHVPDEVRAHMTHGAIERGKQAQAAWQEKLAAYAKAHPDLYAQFELCMAGKLPEGWDKDLPTWKQGEKQATRNAGGKVQNAIAKKVPWLFGGDADLGHSTKTIIEGGGDFNAQTGAGRNIHFGVREHAMGSICNGMAYHGGIRPYGATFFVFSDYMRPAVRLAALNHLPVIFVWTHDSIGLGEDGPTHQPVEHLMALRAIPNLHVVRPGGPNETTEAWVHAMKRTDGPTALILSRQDLPVLNREKQGEEATGRGGYVLADAPGGKPDAILMATGSELSLAVEAQKKLAGEGVNVRVVSMPCWEQFRAQTKEYRDSVLPPSVTARVSIEAGITWGWEVWIGQKGASIGIDRYGASAPGEELMEKFGFSVSNVVAKVREVIAANK